MENPKKVNLIQRVSVSKKDDFESVARRLECDEDKARFEEKLGKLARAKPNKETPQ